MQLNTFECKYLMLLHFKGLNKKRKVRP